MLLAPLNKCETEAEKATGNFNAWPRLPTNSLRRTALHTASCGFGYWSEPSTVQSEWRSTKGHLPLFLWGKEYK